jgi:hypothetical protein
MAGSLAINHAYSITFAYSDPEHYKFEKSWSPRHNPTRPFGSEKQADPEDDYPRRGR